MEVEAAAKISFKTIAANSIRPYCKSNPNSVFFPISPTIIFANMIYAARPDTTPKTANRTD